jgi:hypothetical protein
MKIPKDKWFCRVCGVATDVLITDVCTKCWNERVKTPEEWFQILSNQLDRIEERMAGLIKTMKGGE